MKKIYTLALALGIVSFSFAQDHRSAQSQSRDVILGQHQSSVVMNNHDRDAYNKGMKSRDAEIQKINREYDMKIQALHRDRGIRKADLNRRVADLERQRAREIQACQTRFNNQWGRYSR